MIDRFNKGVLRTLDEEDNILFEVKPQSETEDNKNRESLFARLISLLLHPLFMASYGVALLFIYTDFSYMYSGRFLQFMLPVVLLTCIIPLSCLFTLVQLGVVSDYEVKNKEERPIVFIIALMSYGLLFYYFYSSGFYIWFLAMLLAPMLLLLIGAIVNSYWKISAHMLSLGCLIGSVLSICYNIKGINPYFLFVILFILAGALGVSRIILKRHTPAQVYVGFLVGIVVSYLCIWIGANFAYIYFFLFR